LLEFQRKSDCICLKAIREGEDTIELANKRIWHLRCYEEYMKMMTRWPNTNFQPDQIIEDAEKALSHVLEAERDIRLTDWLKSRIKRKEKNKGSETSDTN